MIVVFHNEMSAVQRNQPKMKSSSFSICDFQSKIINPKFSHSFLFVPRDEYPARLLPHFFNPQSSIRNQTSPYSFREKISKSDFNYPSAVSLQQPPCSVSDPRSPVPIHHSSFILPPTPIRSSLRFPITNIPEGIPIHTNRTPIPLTPDP
jgi:hypothetical protein